jgi:hypothetical protein
MICFLTTTGYDFTLKSIRSDPGAPPISTLTYRRALKESVLPEATYVFTDIDRLSIGDLIAAASLYRRLKQEGRRVLNDPARVHVRFPLLRALYRSGINPFNVYSVSEGDKPERFPVFLRLSSGHDAPLSDLIFEQDALERAIAAAVTVGFPRQALMVVEYAAEPVQPGLFRKLSVFRVGDEFIPHVCVHDSSWMVKLGRAGIAGQELYEEELEIMQKNAFADRLKPVFAIADIDYGRADFGLVGDRICVYEINTNPQVNPIRTHPFAQRVESGRLWWEGFKAALHRLDAARDHETVPAEATGPHEDAVR